MSRRSLLLGIGTLLVLLGVAGCALVLLVRHEPDAYRALAVPPGEEREKLSKQFYVGFCNLVNGIQNDAAWEAEFTTEQINSYLGEDFVRSGVGDRILPCGMSE